MKKSVLKQTIFLVFALVLLAGQFGIAQPIPTCLDLTELQTNPGGQTFYGPQVGQEPGDTIATLENVNVIIDQIIQSSGDTVFLDLIAYDSSVLYQTSAIKFDFSDVSDQVNRFEIEVVSFIGPYYIALNDGQLFEVDSIEHIGRVLPSDAVFNYDVSITPPGSRRYNFTIDHPSIDNITFGAGETSLISACYSKNPVDPSNCTDFLALQQNPGSRTFYGQNGGQEYGETIGVLENMTLSVEPAIDENGDTFFVDLVVYDTSASLAFISLKFDLTTVPEEVNRFTLEVNTYGGPYNFAFNGGQTFVLDSIEHIARVLPPDATFDYTTGIGTFGRTNYRIVISHPNIDDILFGAAETQLIVACYTTTTACSISNLTFEPEPCTPNGIFYGEFNARYANTISDSFDLRGNGNDYGRFAYTDLPVRVGPITGDPNRELEFIISDISNNCRNILELDPIDCDDECNIGEIILTPSPCDANNEFSVNLDFDYQNIGPNGFMVIGDGNFYGIFQYTDLPLNLGPFTEADQPLEFNVFDAADPACINFAELSDVDCDRDTCNIRDVAVSTVCTNDGNFSAYFSFLYDHDGSPVVWISDETGATIGVGAADNQPIQVAVRTNPNLTRRTFTLCFDDQPDCCERVEFRQPDCTAQCDFVEWGLRRYNCINDSLFTVEAFVQLDGNSDSVGILLDNRFYGEYPLDRNNFAEAIIGPLQSDIRDSYLITFYDPLRPDCFVIDTIVTPDCGNSCAISNLVVRPDSCLTDTTLTLTLDFDYQDADNDFFDVFDDSGNIVGTYRLNQLPVFITNFPKTGRDFQSLTVCINDNPDCCASTRFRVPGCVPNNCIIWNLEATLSDCDSLGRYTATLDFNFTPDVDSFVVDVANGLSFVYSTSQLPVRIGPFTSGTEQNIRVYNPLNPSCSAYTEFDKDCPLSNCPIANARIIDSIICNRDGSYFVPFDFDYNSPVERIFNVVDERGILVFRTSTRALPATMLLFPSDTTFRNLRICIEGLPDCCTRLRFDEPECELQCRFGEVDIVDYECINDSFYYATAVVEILNPNDSFNIDIDGDFYGQYVYDAPRTIVRLGPFESNTNRVRWVDFYDPSDPDCAIGDTLLNFDCVDICNIFNVQADTGQCNTDGTYELTIDFDYFNNGTDSFNVYSGTRNEFVGAYALDDLPVTVDFTASGRSTDVLIIEIRNQSNCQESLRIVAPDCAQDICKINEVWARHLPCDSSGQFFVEVNIFNFLNTSDSFNIRGNGRDYGIYGYRSLPVRLGPFNGDGTTEYEFEVIDLEDPNCSNFYELGTIDCDSTNTNNCRIYDTEVYSVDCNADGTYQLILDFEVDNPVSDQFKVYSRAGLQGQYSYRDLPIFINSFEGLGVNNEVLLIEDVRDTTCITRTTFPGLNCGDCSIFNLSVSPVDCANRS